MPGHLCVKVGEGRNLAGSEWGGVGNFFCRVRYEGAVQETRVIYKETNPKWNEIFVFYPDIAGDDSLSVNVLERSIVDGDVSVGSLKVTNVLDSEGGVSRKAVKVGGGVVPVEVSFSPVDGGDDDSADEAEEEYGAEFWKWNDSAYDQREYARVDESKGMASRTRVSTVRDTRGLISRQSMEDIDTSMFQEDTSTGVQSMKGKKGPAHSEYDIPMGAAESDGKAPSITPELEWVYGQCSWENDNCVHIDHKGRVLYFCAAVAIRFQFDDDASKGQQAFFRNHTDDITCMAISPDKKTIATGQVGVEPRIWVWDVDTLEPILDGPLHMGRVRGIQTLTFSSDGKRLAAVGRDDQNSLTVFDLTKGGAIIGSAHTGGSVRNVRHDPASGEFVTLGPRHLKHWKVDGIMLKGRNCIIGRNGKRTVYLTCGFANKRMFVATALGDIYVFQDWKLEGTYNANNSELAKSPLNGKHATLTVAMDDTGDRMISTGSDGRVCLWDTSSMQLLRQRTLASSVMRTATFGLGMWIVGTKQGELISMDAVLKKPRIRLEGHFVGKSKLKGENGELWGLAVCPQQNIFLTGGDDSFIRIWDSRTHAQILKYRFVEEVTAVAYSPDGKYFAVGGEKGLWQVLQKVEGVATKGAAEPAPSLGEIATGRLKKRIVEMKWSPDSSRLAIASKDLPNSILILNCRSSGSNGKRYSPEGMISGSSHYSHFDWSKDGRYIHCNNAAHESQVFMTNGTKADFNASSIQWATWTCHIGGALTGVYRAGAQANDINAVDRSRDSTLMAVGDDDGMVHVYKYPVRGRSQQSKVLAGHSSHITSVRFLNVKGGDSRLITLGGHDHAAMQWRIHSA